jgi:hypothetical protein
LGFYGSNLVIVEEEGRASKSTELRELIPPLNAIDVSVV